MIAIVPYKPLWPDEFLEIGTGLRRNLGDLALRIDHIGSTSVPGLAAKDVIDIQVTVAELTPALERAFTQAGFQRMPYEVDHLPPGREAERSEWQKWMFKSVRPQRPANVHVRLQGRANQRYALLFRDYLRAFPAIAQAYAQVKTALVRHHPEDDMDVYYEVKDPACDLIIGGAEAWAACVNWAAGPTDC